MPKKPPKLVRSNPMSFGQLESLNDGAIVWVRYQKSGEPNARIDQAARLEKVAEGIWEFWDPETESSICDLERERDTSNSDLVIKHTRGEFQVFSTISEIEGASDRGNINRPRA